ncbi:MAG: HD domain-containing protein [Bdellovibrionales bacterium]|nr:HD domain-containing protein [Bdellovibrionales bacterium]
METVESKDFVSIRVSTLRGDLKINFDAYIQIAGKQILYCRKGDSFEGSRLKRLKEKKLKKMYIRSDDEKLYRDYMSNNIEMAYDQNTDRPIESRAEIIQGVQQAAAEDVMDNPESEAFYNVAKEGSGRFVDFIKKEQKALCSILKLPNEDNSISHHGVTVASLAVGLAEKLNLDDTVPMNLLILGALIHDIEHQHHPVPFQKTLQEMTTDEAALYEMHPYNGADRVKSFPFYDKTVINIILQHEEFIDGSGFPKGLREAELDPLAILVSTANSYDRLVSFYGKAPKDALKMLLIEKMGLHPLNHLQLLQTVLKDNGIV